MRSNVRAGADGAVARSTSSRRLARSRSPASTAALIAARTAWSEARGGWALLATSADD